MGKKSTNKSNSGYGGGKGKGSGKGKGKGGAYTPVAKAENIVGTGGASGTPAASEPNVVEDAKAAAGDVEQRIRAAGFECAVTEPSEIPNGDTNGKDGAKVEESPSRGGAKAEDLIGIGKEVQVTTPESKVAPEAFEIFTPERDPAVATTEEENADDTPDSEPNQEEIERLKRIEDQKRRIEEKRNARKKKWEDEEAKREAKLGSIGEGEEEECQSSPDKVKAEEAAVGEDTGVGNDSAAKDTAEINNATTSEAKVDSFAEDFTQAEVEKGEDKQAKHIAVPAEQPTWANESALQAQTDKATVIAAVRNEPSQLRFANSEMKADKAVVLAAMRKDGLALEFAADSLRADKDMALTAVRENGMALQFVSEALKEQDPAVVKAAVRRNGLALAHASTEQKANREIVFAAVMQNGDSLACASDELRGDPEFVLSCQRRNASSIAFAATELLEDREFMLRAAQWDSSALNFTSESLRAELLIESG